jgi:hypothetical protein
MSGGTRVYYCDNCPLVLELGGYSDEDRHVIQVVCAACGALHRFDAQDGTVTALQEPLRATRTVTARDVSGEEIETCEWVPESGWQPTGRHSGGVDSPFPCHHCGAAGRMISLQDLLYPDGSAVDDPRRVDCPLCQSAMECVAVTDSI